LAALAVLERTESDMWKENKSRKTKKQDQQSEKEDISQRRHNKGDWLLKTPTEEHVQFRQP